MSSSSAQYPWRRLRSVVGRIVRWLYRSGHRQMLTKELRGTVAALRGIALDVGGGPDSVLAGSWTPAVRRIRVDIEVAGKPDVQGDAQRLPVRSSSVDAVLISEVLQYVANPRAAVMEAHRVLRSGGMLVASVPFLASGVHDNAHDYYRYTDAGLRLLLGNFGDVDVRAHGNAFGASWRIVFSRLRFLVPLNPVMRNMGRWADPLFPEGYVVRARK